MKFKKITVANPVEATQAKKPRRFYSKREREHLIKLWQESNLSQVEFCKQHNINIKNFYRWRTQLRALEEQKALPQEVSFTSSVEDVGFNLQCQLPNGIKLLFNDVVKPSVLTWILKEVCQCKFN